MAYTHKNRSIQEREYLFEMGLLIKHYRLKRNMTQLELAMAINVMDPVTIVRYEQGRVTMPVYRLQQIALALKVSIVSLIPEP
jgi:transcriptional regulator with XRE-family HTH domain